MSDTVERTGLDRFVDLPDDNDFLAYNTVRKSDDTTIICSDISWLAFARNSGCVLRTDDWNRDDSHSSLATALVW